MKYCYHFTDEATEAWRGSVPHSRLTTSLEKPAFESKQSGLFLIIMFVILPLIYLVPLLNWEVEATLTVYPVLPCQGKNGVRYLS